MNQTIETLLRLSAFQLPLSSWLPVHPPSAERCWMGPDGRPAISRADRCWRPAVFDLGEGAGFPCCGRCRLLPAAKTQRFAKTGTPALLRQTELERTGPRRLQVKATDGFLFQEGLDYWLDWDAGTIALAAGSRIAPGIQLHISWEFIGTMGFVDQSEHLNRAARRRLLRASQPKRFTS